MRRIAGRCRRRIFLRTLLTFVISSCGLVGCRNTEFFEREKLTNPIMDLGGSPTEIHFYQKSYYSREGSVGGFGSSAGGGCGCY